MKRRLLLYVCIYVGSLLYAAYNTMNSIIAIDIRYIDWDIMPIVDISPQNFEKWRGQQIQITDPETIQHLITQIMFLHEDTTSSFDVRGKISIVFPNDTMIYYYSKFYLYDGTQYYTMSPLLEQNLLELTEQFIYQ